MVTVGDESRRKEDAASSEESERLYHLGALAQSYVPRGVADVLNLSPEGRAKARLQWRAQPRRKRMALHAVLVIEIACLGVITWGVARRDGLIVLVGGGAIVAVMLGTAVATIVSDVRRAKAGREAHRTSRRPPSAS